MVVSVPLKNRLEWSDGMLTLQAAFTVAETRKPNVRSAACKTDCHVHNRLGVVGGGAGGAQVSVNWYPWSPMGFLVYRPAGEGALSGEC